MSDASTFSREPWPLTLNARSVIRRGMESRSSDPPPIVNESPLGLKMMIEVFEALVRNGVPSGYRVVYRTNPRGEHVVAVIWPPETP